MALYTVFIGALIALDGYAFYAIATVPIDEFI